jgi:hypothetical protein
MKIVFAANFGVVTCGANKVNKSPSCPIGQEGLATILIVS